MLYDVQMWKVQINDFVFDDVFFRTTFTHGEHLSTPNIHTLTGPN